MQKKLLLRLESVLLEYIRGFYLPVRFRKFSTPSLFTEKDLLFFAKGAAILSDFFTINRSSLAKNYFNKRENRSAYLLYFTLTNFTKTLKCLHELLKIEGHFSQAASLDILDLGCGPATASLAASAFFRDKRLSILGVDQNLSILKDAKSIFSAFGQPFHRFEYACSQINPKHLPGSLHNKRFDIIIAANLLSEIGSVEDGVRLCRLLMDRCLKNSGAIIIIDPALRKTTQDLMQLRDALRSHVISPCLHQAFCPMLRQQRRDWCHFYLEWDCPKTIRRLDKLIDIRHEYLKMAYLILGKSPTPPAGKLDLWRVVSSPLSSKGKCEFVLCGNENLFRLSRLARDASEINRGFDHIKRGDIIKFSCKDFRLTKDDRVDIESPFNCLS